MKKVVLVAALSLALSSCGNDTSEPTNSSGTWRSAKEIVLEHLRNVELGNWQAAEAAIGDSYSMTGTIPFPISVFVKIGKAQSMQMHKPRKRAMPDFKFNERILEETPNRIKLEINLTGTQTGVIDYTGVLNNIPIIQPTNKKLKLASEFFTYYVKDNQIIQTIGEIPKGAGVDGLIKAVQQP